MISVICVYNNEEQLKTQLEYSLKFQTVELEFIRLDNRDGKYESAAKALNLGARIAKGDILIFSHQDIYLKTENEIEELARVIDQSLVGTIIGTQGVVENSKKYYSCLTAGDVYNGDLNFDFKKRLYEVACIDEGLFGMKKSTWEAHHFDELICNNWHLYAVEQCLYARSHSGKVYVYPSQIHHFSKGRISLEYMKNMRELCRKYRNSFKYIWTTCYKVRTSNLYINGLITIWYLNRVIRRKSL